jgi:hypothetical protein
MLLGARRVLEMARALATVGALLGLFATECRRKENTMRRTVHSPGLAAMLLTLLGVTLSSVAQAQAPPKDMVALNVVLKVTHDPASQYLLPLAPPLEIVKSVGTAEGAPIGKVTVVESQRAQYGVDGKVLFYQGTGIWTGANGDAIFYTFLGLGNENTEAFLITGGTGRFQGATGSGGGTWTANADFTELTITLVGFISPPKP